MAAKTIFGYFYCAIMISNANYQENDAVDIIVFFASKQTYPKVRQLEKITVKKAPPHY